MNMLYEFIRIQFWCAASVFTVIAFCWGVCLEHLCALVLHSSIWWSLSSHLFATEPIQQKGRARPQKKTKNRSIKAIMIAIVPSILSFFHIHALFETIFIFFCWSFILEILSFYTTTYYKYVYRLNLSDAQCMCVCQWSLCTMKHI